ncbi:MAG: Gfo/Idh/MocA family protein [Bacillota bacterium]
MKFLIVGLGSMGKRRIRCLKAIGYNNVFGFDLRDDRRHEVEQKYSIKTFSDINLALDDINPTALIISVPPDVHHEYIKIAIKRRIHFFVEASVVDTDMELIKNELQKAGIIGAPSATLVFHPAIKIISKIIKTEQLGKISNIILHSGQYLPDWHKYEHVSDYYVSNPATGGAREIVPFELTWLTNLLGFPQLVSGNVRKTISIKGAERIEDTYNFLLDYKDFLASVTVDIVSRFAIRRLLINGDQKQLVWDWNVNCVKIYDPEKMIWNELSYEMKIAEQGYNSNIGENMYIEELRSFINAIRDNTPFTNTMERDHQVLKLLYAIEESDKTKQFVRFS